ncbi:MAG: glutamate racemase [Flavobacteriales bacterium]
MATSNQPIGIFDSGIGGLTVANAISKLLPNEKIIYFGDTAHVPYGDKSVSNIQFYSQNIADFLLEKNCKIIVIACNTASAAARKTTAEHVKNTPVLNVIDPVVEHVASYFSKSTIGLIGTKGTINSRVYPKAIKKANKSIETHSLATPLLAPMIEEGFFNNNISKTIISAYLDKSALKGIDALILGCTHYPLIQKEIEAVYKKKKEKIKILNSADIVANSVKDALKNQKLLSKKDNPKHEFYVSDYTASFEESTKIFFGAKVKLKEVNLWK